MNNEHDNEQLHEYLDEVEKGWRGLNPKFTPEFLREAFPEISQDASDILESLSQKRNELIYEIARRLEPYAGRTDFDAIFVRECVKHFLVTELLQVESSIGLLERILNEKPSETTTKSFLYASSEIQRAREVSIVDVAERLIGEIRKSGASYSAKCPFHEEKSASFHLYPDSNRYHCFGCTSSGDVIDLVQKNLSLTFPQTISYLLQK